MLVPTKAIVLSQIRVGENGRILRLYTQSHGPVSVMVKGAKRASVRGVMMQPLTLIDVVVKMRPRQDIHYIQECTVSDILTNVPLHPVKSAIALYMAELLTKTLRAHQEDDNLFAFLRESILFLDRATDKYANFHLVFTIKLTYFLGIFPNLSGFDEDVYFDMQNGSFTSRIPLHHDYLGVEESMTFAHLMRLNYDNMGVFSLNRGHRQIILEEMMRYYQIHISSFGELQSLSILEQLFD